MQSGKDYYGILGLQPGATQRDVKRSFRKLALQYHPDKHNGGSFDTNAAYANIQEAYHVLSHPKLREAYLQERWLLRSQGKPLGKTAALTPKSILADIEALQQTINLTDQHRMHHAGMADKLLHCLQANHLAILAEANELAISQQVFDVAVAASQPIDYKHLKSIFLQLTKLADQCGRQPMLKSYLAARQKAFWWQKNQYWIIVLATLAICALIFFA